MKHLKLYELYYISMSDLKIGDYILIHSNKLKKSFPAKVVDQREGTKYQNPKIEVELVDGSKHLSYYNVIRQLSDEEIEKYKIEKEANKYNL